MFTKYASATITAHSGSPKGKTAGMKTCGSFEYEPRTDHRYLYVAARACTADVPNLNYDMLPDRELKTAYKSFVGSYVYLNHDNTDPRKARGAIIDAKYHTEDPDDKWVEILMELDEEKAPKLCSYIRSGEIDTVSMGASVASTDCSVCGNNAEYPFEYCEHIQNKGQEYGGKLAYEICNGIDFFEESLVYNPADPTAYVQGLNEETEVKEGSKRQYIVSCGSGRKNSKAASKKRASVLDIPLSECSSADFSTGAIEEGYQEIEWFTQTAVDDGIYEDVTVYFEYMPVYFRGELLGYVGGAYDAEVDDGLDLFHDEPEGFLDFDWSRGQKVEDLESYFTDGYVSAYIEDMAANPEGYGLPENPTINDLIHDEEELEPFALPDELKAFAKSAAFSFDMRSRLSDYVHDAYGNDYAFSVTADGDWFISGKSDFFTDNQTFGCPNRFTNYAREIDAVMGRYGISRRNGWKAKEPYRDMKWAKSTVCLHQEWCKVDDGHYVTSAPEFDEPGGWTVFGEVRFGADAEGLWSASIMWGNEDGDIVSAGDGYFEAFETEVEAMAWVENALFLNFNVRVSAKCPEKNAKDGTSFADAPKRPENVSSQEEKLVCPLCGSESFDGDYCSVCGYQEPPEGFGDIEIETEEDMESYEEVETESDTEETEDENEKEASLEKIYDIADDPRYFINVADEVGGDYTLIDFDILKTDDVYVQDALEDAGAIEISY